MYVCATRKTHIWFGGGPGGSGESWRRRGALQRCHGDHTSHPHEFRPWRLFQKYGDIWRLYHNLSTLLTAISTFIGRATFIRLALILSDYGRHDDMIYGGNLSKSVSCLMGGGRSLLEKTVLALQLVYEGHTPRATPNPLFPPSKRKTHNPSRINGSYHGDTPSKTNHCQGNQVPWAFDKRRSNSLIRQK